MQTRQSHMAPTKQMSEQHKQDSVPNMRNDLFSVGAEMEEQSERSLKKKPKNPTTTTKNHKTQSQWLQIIKI